jgi:hypothetical protein
MGVLFFALGTWLEDTHHTGKDLLLSTFLAISIGAFTGGLQHFPDSPERSVWILPL